MRTPTVLVLVLALGCAPESVEPQAVSPVSAPAQPSAPSPADRTGLAELRAHLDFGRLDAALAVLDLARTAGPEEPLLRARAAALEGKTLEAIRLVETARASGRPDAEVFATAAEIYAFAGKLDAAWEEAKAGEALFGEAPPLLRARGILWISRQGGAAKGLALLEDARRRAPGLSFCDRALSQAHLLAGKSAAAARKPAEALAHARSAVGFDQDDVDARRFLSETLAGSGDFDGAIAELALLIGRGEPLGSELALTHKKAGFAALLGRERDQALAHFAAARRLGLTDSELSSGARLLEEEADVRVECGVDAYARGDLAAAEKAFRGALELDADRIDAQNHLAVALFQGGDFAGAAKLWRAVLETAGAEKLDLPEPVHLNLARAQALGGDTALARKTLEEYLQREPGGAWAADTRALLSEIAAGTPR